MKYKKFAAGLVAAGVAAGLSACGGSTPAPGGSGSPSAQSSQMFTWISSEGDRAQWQSFIDGAKQTDPNFNLTLDGPSFQEYWTKVKTRMNSADAPCILTTQAARAQGLKDILIPLDDLAKEAGLDLSKYNAGMIQGMTVDGTVRAIPYDAEPMVLYYNKTLFQKAGLKDPGLDYTQAQFLSDAKALTKDGVMGFGLAPDPGYPYLPLAFANGNTPVKDGALALTDPGFVSDVQWTFDLAVKEKVASAPNPADTTDVPMQGFQAGKIAMIIDGPWFYTSIREPMTDEVGVAVIPSKDGKPVGMIQGSGFGISAKCPDPANAFANIMKITTPEVIAYVGEHRGTVPSLEASFDGWAKGKPEADVKVMKALLAEGLPLITTSNWNQFVTLFTQYSSEGTRGAKTAEEILGTIQTSVG